MEKTGMMFSMRSTVAGIALGIAVSAAVGFLAGDRALALPAGLATVALAVSAPLLLSRPVEKPVFAPLRPIAGGLATATIVAAAIGHFVSDVWGLTTLCAHLAGAAGTAHITLRRERFAGLSAADARYQWALWLLPYFAVLIPVLSVDDAAAVSQQIGLPPALLFGATGFAGYYFGVIARALTEIATGDPPPDPRLHRLTAPPDGDRRSAA